MDIIVVGHNEIETDNESDQIIVHIKRYNEFKQFLSVVFKRSDKTNTAM